MSCFALFLLHCCITLAVFSQYGFVAAKNHVIYTENNGSYVNWFPVPESKIFNFKIMAKAFKINLASYPINEDPKIEIAICQPSPSKSGVILRNNKEVTILAIDNKYYPDTHKFTDYWVTWFNNNVKIGAKGETEGFLSFNDPSPFPIQYIGVSTQDSKWSGIWILENN